MQIPPNEDGKILASIRNPVVDDWNDAPESTATTGLDASDVRGLPAGRRLDHGDTRRPAATPATAPVRSAPTVLRGSDVEAVLARWVPVLLAIALYAALSGLHDTLGNLTAPRLGDPRWRFGLVAQTGLALLKFVFCASFLTFALLVSEQRTAARLVMWLMALGAVVLPVVAPFFLLDALQVRAILPSGTSDQRFLVNVAFTLTELVASATVLGTCAWALRGQLRRRTDNRTLVEQAWDQ